MPDSAKSPDVEMPRRGEAGQPPDKRPPNKRVPPPESSRGRQMSQGRDKIKHPPAGSLPPEMGMKHTFLAATVIGLAIACAPLLAEGAVERPVDFAREIQPILAKNCFACHGPDEKHREAGLRLDLRASAVKKLDDGKTAIVPGHIEASELVRRITTTVADDRMPPADAPTTLTKEQIGLLTGWVAQGRGTACTGRSRNRSSLPSPMLPVPIGRPTRLTASSWRSSIRPA